MRYNYERNSDGAESVSLMAEVVARARSISVPPFSISEKRRTWGRTAAKDLIKSPERNEMRGDVTRVTNASYVAGSGQTRWQWDYIGGKR